MRNSDAQRWSGGPLGLALMLLVCTSGGCADIVPSPDAFASADDSATDTSDTGADGAVDTQADTGGPDVGETDGGVDTADTGTDTAGGDVDAVDTPDTPDTSCDPKDCGDPPGPCTTWTCKAGGCELVDLPDDAPCDDGFTCTTGDKCADGICLGTNATCVCTADADCASKEDGDFCNGTLFCDLSGAEPACKVNPATLVSCPSVDDTDCQVNACEKKSGQCKMELVKVQPGKFFVPCDDGNPCTQNDQCKDGACLSGTNVCECKFDSDCKASEDGNPCTGTLYCDLLGTAPTCKPNPITVVKCEDDGNPCTVVACDSATGKCTAKPVAENAKCDDGNPCTDDTCQSGVCTPGVSNCGCKNDLDCAKQNPKNQCAGTLYCDKASSDKTKWACKPNPATVVTCNDADDTACRTNVCDPDTGQCGFEYANKFEKCDDGSPCTTGDTCDGKGTCVSGTSTCVCEKDADCADKDDGDLCNGVPFCDLSGSVPTCKTNPATVKVCPGIAGEPCKENACDPKTGQCAVKNKPDTTGCTDGLACVEAGSCVGGSCILSDVNCGCVTDNDCQKPSVNDCEGTPYCDKSVPDKKKWTCKAVPGSEVKCPGAAAGTCLAPTCKPSTGSCEPVPTDTLCDDGNPCTFDVCQIDGSCKHPYAGDGYGCGTGKQCAAAKCVDVPATMILVPGGDGYAGCAASDSVCLANEGKATLVKLAAFLIDRHEVSVADFNKNCPDCLEKPATIGAGCNAGASGKELHPANCVSWTAANAYCQKLGRQLPTEAQWERAARGGCEVWGDACAAATPIYPWAKPIATCDFAVMHDVTGDGCGAGGTASVGTYSQDDSPYGVRDLGGNVQEWTRDGYVAEVWTGTAMVDPEQAPGPSGERVVKGGGFSSSAPDVRSSRRAPLAPAEAPASLGFRCVQALK